MRTKQGTHPALFALALIGFAAICVAVAIILRTITG